jgi:hypothetical protein
MKRSLYTPMIVGIENNNDISTLITECVRVSSKFLKMHNDLFSLLYLSGNPFIKVVSYILYSCDSDNIFVNDNNFKDSLRRYDIHLGGNGTMSNNHVNVVVSKACDEGLLLRKSKGIYMVNPIAVSRVSDEKRRQLIRDWIELNNKIKIDTEMPAGSNTEILARAGS